MSDLVESGISCAACFPNSKSWMVWPKSTLAWAAEIKLRAWRRMGEISAALPKSKPGPNSQLLPMVGSNSKAEVLEHAGITTQDASRAETVAAIDEGVFEQYAAEKKARGDRCLWRQPGVNPSQYRGVIGEGKGNLNGWG